MMTAGSDASILASGWHRNNRLKAVRYLVVALTSASLTDVGMKTISHFRKKLHFSGSFPAGLSKIRKEFRSFSQVRESIWLTMLPLFGEPDARNMRSSLTTEKRSFTNFFNDALLVDWTSISMSSILASASRVASPRQVKSARVLYPHRL